MGGAGMIGGSFDLQKSVSDLRSGTESHEKMGLARRRPLGASI
jgi:hypothetical protein